MTWLLYGAYGYTGELIAREAARRGMHPVLAGRNEARLRPLAEELNLSFQTFSLNDHSSLVEQIDGMEVVLNCAGPFSRTAQPMMDACLAAGPHYLDITGEIDVIEAAAALDAPAREAGVVLMPAVGFDVVPTDCLAAMLAERLPSATHLRLALAALPNVSPGTGKTMAEMLPSGGRVRQEGKIVRVPLAHQTNSFVFADRRRQCVTMPWGDVASAYHTTGIENIEVYFALPKRQIKWLQRLRWLLPLAGFAPVQAMWKSLIGRSQTGPTDDQRRSQRAQLWGEVQSADGTTRSATMTTPNGYALTVETALASVEQVLSEAPSPGFLTPAKAFGSEFIRQFDIELNWPDGA